MSNPFVRKLAHGALLGSGDCEKLEKISARTRTVEAHTDLIREGENPSEVRLVMSGFACRYKLLRDGSRQIIAFLLPGDFCDVHVAILGHIDHNIATLTCCDVVEIPGHEILDLTRHSPAIAHACWWSTLVDESILREWLVNMGQRPADKRVAHLFCELHLRMQAVGLATDTSCPFPLTQAQLGDSLGMSLVHANRTIQNLRERGLVTLAKKELQFHDIAELRRFAEFDGAYLYLDDVRSAGSAT